MLQSSHKICSNILRSPSYNLITSPEIFCPSQYLIILSSSELFYFSLQNSTHDILLFFLKNLLLNLY